MSGDEEASELRRRLKDMTAELEQRTREVGELARANAEVGLMNLALQSTLRSLREQMEEAAPQSEATEAVLRPWIHKITGVLR